MFEISLKDDVYPSSSINQFRITVRAILRNEMNQFAFLQILGHDDFGVRNHLETIGGGVNTNEDHATALKRECLEEAGFIVEVGQKLGVITDEYNLIHRRTESHFYVCQLVEQGYPTQRQENEKLLMQQVEWLTYAQAIVQLESTNLCDIGKLIHRRDRMALKFAYQLLEGIER